MLVEVLLQLLVGKVDVELLEAVDLKVLKAKDVEHPDEGEPLQASFDSDVDAVEDPAKEVGVKSHGHRVS